MLCIPNLLFRAPASTTHPHHQPLHSHLRTPTTECEAQQVKWFLTVELLQHAQCKKMHSIFLLMSVWRNPSSCLLSGVL